MTDEEKIQQRKNLLYECEQAEVALSHLVEKAKATADALADLSGLLEHYANTPFNPEHPAVYRRSGAVIDTGYTKYRDAMNYDSLNVVLTELWDAKRRAHALRQRRDAIRG
jgi:hypothetical protein